MNKNFSFHLILCTHVEVQVHLLVDPHIGVAERVHRQAVLARPRDLEAQFGFDQPFSVADALKGDNAGVGSTLHQKDPPLLKLRLREKWSMHRTHRLALVQVLAQQLDGHGGNVAHHNLFLIFDLCDRLALHVAAVTGKSLDVCNLVSGHGGKALPLLWVLLQIVCQGRGRILAFKAVLQDLIIEMRDLQQLRTLHIQGLNQGPPEFDHGLSCEEPLSHAGDFNHRLRNLQ
mmetsp:Transcript_32131/g.69438  ORF Transcript_32131/g.69438 Transcript_32131/m.69438 type:complete len:231 (-) Transcript_32131:1098-1790(-)